MVKHVFIDLDEAEFEEALNLKGNRTWKEVLKDGLKVKKE